MTESPPVTTAKAGTAASQGSGPTPNQFEPANNRIRDAAKWLVASSAAVGAALIAGSQLSSVGALEPGPRLWVAFAGAILALAAVVYAIWSAVGLLLPKLVLVHDLADAWDSPRGELKAVVAQFKRNSKYLQGLPSPEVVMAVRQQRVAAYASAAQEDKADAYAKIVDIDARITAIEDTAAHEALKAQFAHTLQRLLVATVGAALGIVAFAWAANPPTRTPAADLRNARLVNANLRDADLRNAKLDNADLTGADLTGGNLSGASIAGVVWRATTCPDGTQSDHNGGTCAGHLS